MDGAVDHPNDDENDDYNTVIPNSSDSSNISNNTTRRTSHTGTGGASTGDTRACAACKYHRRRCDPNCALAPYFPPDHQKQFLNAHRLFGLKKMMKAYSSVQPPLRDDSIKSMIFEANIRAIDPVGGCYSIIQGLKHQLYLCSTELKLVQSELAQIHYLSNVAQSESVANAAENMIHELSLHFAQEFGPENTDLFAWLRYNDGDIESIASRGDTNPTSHDDLNTTPSSYTEDFKIPLSGDLNPTPSCIDGSEDFKIPLSGDGSKLLVDDGEVVKSNLIDGKKLNLSSKNDEPKDEASAPPTEPQQEGIKGEISLVSR